MQPLTPESLRARLARASGWLIPAALLALTPKCVLCVLAYAGIGTALGLGGPEICGALGETSGHPAMLLILSGVATVLAALRLFGRNHRNGSSRHYNDQIQP